MPHRATRSWLHRRLVAMAWRVGAFQDALYSRSRMTFLLLLATTLLLAPGLSRLELDNRIDAWLPPIAAVEEESFAHDGEDFLLLLRRNIESGDWLSEDVGVARSAEILPQVQEVECVSRWLAKLGVSRVSDLGDGAKFMDGYLLFEGGRTAVQRVWLEPGTVPAVVVAHLRSVLGSVEGEWQVLGPAAFNARLDTLSRGESLRVMPLAFAVIFVLYALLLRSLRAAAALTVAAATGVVWHLGLLAALGGSFNFLTINVPLLAFVVAAALGTHPLHAWRRIRGRTAGAPSAVSRREGPAAATRRTFPGNFLSAVTTTIGFGSLTLAGVPAIREFGLLAATAVPVVFVSGLLTFPLVLRVCERGSWTYPLVGRFALRWTASLRRHPELVYRASFISVTLAVLALPGLVIRQDALAFFSPEDSFRREFTETAEAVHGLAPIEYVVDLPGPISTVENLRLLEAFVSSVEEQTATPRVLSILDVVRLANSRLAGGSPGSFRLPSSDVALRLAWAMVSTRREALAPLVSGSDSSLCRIVLSRNLRDGDDLTQLCRRVDGTLQKFPSVTARPVGRIYRVVKVQDEILREQISSLAFAITGVSLLVGIFFFSAVWASLALLIHLSPLLLTGGFMVVARLPLDLTSAMVASIALGIAIDDTLHLLWELQRVGGASRQAVERALYRVAPPMVTTSLVLAAGFGVLATAGFPPISRFGLLTATTLLLSLAAHVTLLPVCLPAVQNWVHRLPGGGRRKGARQRKEEAAAAFAEGVTRNINAPGVTSPASPR